METLHLPSKCLPTIPTKTFEFSHKTHKPSISIRNPHPPTPTDLHLNYLCSKQRLDEAIVVIESSLSTEIRPKTITHLIQSCIDSGSIDIGRKIHQLVGFLKTVDPFIETKLVGLYAKCGFLDDARKVFDEIHEKHLLTWSAIIGGYSRESRWREVVKLFYWMMEDGVLPDGFLFIKILKACGSYGDVNTCKLIHSLVVKCDLGTNVNISTWVLNSILAVYAKCGKLKSARRVFDTMGRKTVVSWNSMMMGYCLNGEIEEARKLLNLMREEGIEPGLVTWNQLISSCNRMGRCDVAMELMKEMTSYGLVPDVFAYTAMISGFCQNNRSIQALNLFKEMLLEGIQPNGVTLTSAISACSSLKVLEKGKELHSIAVKKEFHSSVLVGNSLIDMYSKCGELEAAHRVFDVILEKDVYSWNSMIGGYCKAGHFGRAHDLFTEMKKSDVKPDVITWNVMITGYMQYGNVDYALHLFHEMEIGGITQRDTASWNSLIAGYMQNGLKDKALGIFRQMQSRCVEPNYVTILSILPACSNLVAAKKVKEIHGCILRRNLSQTEISLSNSLMDAYAKSGNVLYSKAIFEGMLMKDIVSWNTLLACFVLHGVPYDAVFHFDLIRKHGFKPNEGTFASIISAYGLAKMVDEGERVFSSMTENYNIAPRIDHCIAMVQLYGRSGRLEEAIRFIENMEIKPNHLVWAALLTAGTVHRNGWLASHAAEQMNGSANASLNSKKTGLILGHSWIEVENKVHSFVDDDPCRGYSEDIYSFAKRLEGKHEGREENGCVHSERLALAYALIRSSQESRTIRIVKNQRMSETSHGIAKFVSQAYGHEIYLSDTKCLHHFKDGHCSCDDYW